MTITTWHHCTTALRKDWFGHDGMAWPVRMNHLSNTKQYQAGGSNHVDDLAE